MYAYIHKYFMSPPIIPSMSIDTSPIQACWDRIKQALEQDVPTTHDEVKNIKMPLLKIFHSANLLAS